MTSLHPLKMAMAVVVFCMFATTAILAHQSQIVVVQIAGSFFGLLAISLLIGHLVRSYPYVGGRLAGRARRIIPPAAVALAALALLTPLLTGQMPLSHDHPVHLYKAWHFWEEMLLEGRLRGWSSYWFFGYPAEELYPIGPDIWVILFRLGTLGIFSWETTYSLAFIGVFILAAYAIYAFGRRYLGTLAGVVAALLWILDPGDYREGGWSYTVDWAVWVQILAMAFALLFLSHLENALQRGRPRDHVIAGALLAAALLSHPMNVIFLAVGIPLYLLLRWLVAGRSVNHEIAITTGIGLLGLSLASFWFLPMMARSAWTTSIGDLWRSLSHITRGMVDGTLFANVWPGCVFLGLIGAFIGLAMRRWVTLFLLLMAGVLLFAASSTAFHELSLMTISKSFAKIQYQRLIIPAKACIFLLAGFTLRQLVDWISSHRRERLGQTDQKERQLQFRLDQNTSEHERHLTLRRWITMTLVCLILSPFVRPAVEHLGRTYLRTIGSLRLKRSISYWEDYQQFLHWSANKRDNSKEFYRIAYELDRHNHLMMGAPAFNRTPYYKVGYTPAKLFKHVTETTEDPLYRALSVRYVVSQRPLHRPSLEEEARFGSIRVYRFKEYQPHRYSLSGQGKVEVKAFEEERIHLKLSGTGPDSRLKVHVANYPRWRASLNGEPLAINEAPVYGTTYPMLMEVKAGDGDLIFEYTMRAPDILGALATLVGIGVVILLLVSARDDRLSSWLRQRLSGPGQIARRYIGWVVLAGLVLVAGLVTYRLASGGTGMSEGSLSRLLSGARVSQGGQPCTIRRREAWFCSENSWNYVGPTTSMFNGGLIPCIWAHPVDQGRGPLEITFPRVTLGRAIVGHHGIADGAVDSFTNASPVTLEFRINDQHLQQLVRPNQKGWVSFRVDTSRYIGKDAELSLRISTVHSGGRHYCFDAKIER